jgi:hypothetical protein
MTIASEILANPLVDKDAYALLCRQLRELSENWSGKGLIEKCVMQEIYVIPEIIRGTAGGLRGHSLTLASELDEMAIEVDGLIIDALA